MIYAKCIHGSQIAKSKDEFIRRQGEDHCVYCEGETTYSRNGVATLNCVPLNYVYDCLPSHFWEGKCGFRFIP